MVKCALLEEIRNRDKSVFCMSVADLHGCGQNSPALTFFSHMYQGCNGILIARSTGTAATLFCGEPSITRSEYVR